ncbi:MAG: hypothetical protein JO272_10435 [Pseudonocardiales bacterium]|nr:hypothetical protein [Pseudonocardiales bacterium]
MPDGLGRHVVRLGAPVGPGARRTRRLDGDAGLIAGGNEATAQVWRFTAAAAVTSDVRGAG